MFALYENKRAWDPGVNLKEFTEGRIIELPVFRRGGFEH